MENLLNPLVAAILALSVLPSATRLSAQIAQAIPSLARFLGPLHPLKLFLPVILIFLWRNRQKISRPLAFLIGTTLLIGTVSTLMAASRCGFSPTTLREWASISVGLLAGLAFTLQPRKFATLTVISWVILIYGFTLLDGAYPQGTDWLYSHIFDPETLKGDIAEIGHRVLTGVFGRQSLAKILAWTPWLVMAYFGSQIKKKSPIWAPIALALLTIGSTALILSTSQRGPLIGAIAGGCVFIAHQAFRLRNQRIALFSLGALVLSLILVPFVVPQDILKTRVASLWNHSEATPYAKTAQDNGSFRLKMNRLSLEVIRTHPWGNACIPETEFSRFEVFPAHAHHLFLHQLRERGWIWGFFHLGLWLFALIGAWSLKSWEGSSLAAGITTVLVLGQVDQPWFVLNHAMMMSVFLILGWKGLLK